jgi:hypothetical protein
LLSSACFDGFEEPTWLVGIVWMISIYEVETASATANISNSELGERI